MGVDMKSSECDFANSPDLRIHHPAKLDEHVFLSGCDVFPCGLYVRDVFCYGSFELLKQASLTWDAFFTKSLHGT